MATEYPACPTRLLATVKGALKHALCGDGGIMSAEPRPDLAAIELTLPPPDPKDAERTFHRPIFEPNGAITYPKTQGDWEPPQDINGYVRDPDNKWRFLPLWLPCGLRFQMAFLKRNCGCIDIIMRCNNPQAPVYAERLSHTVCESCQRRIT